MVTYDVVPEIESYLHSIGKTLHGGIDETEDSMAGRADNIGNSDDDETPDEEEKRERTTKQKSVDAHDADKSHKRKR